MSSSGGVSGTKTVGAGGVRRTSIVGDAGGVRRMVIGEHGGLQKRTTPLTVCDPGGVKEQEDMLTDVRSVTSQKAND